MSKNDSVANLAKKITRKAENCQKIVEKQAVSLTVYQATTVQHLAARSTSLTLENCPDTLLFKHPDPWHRACNIPFVNFMLSGLLFLKYANQSCSPCLPDLDAHYATTPYFFLVANAASPDSLDGNDLHIGD
ncbi:MULTISPECIES: hypothetical protein [Pseudomonas]|uniref:Uncharacterized protein n=2 Tax=Pseudomonas syringae group genomosp. 2 TaxID=251698 RepID=A0AB35R9D3_PSEA0|nr:MULTISPECIES: hypothetical protein [Pseudomonas]KPB11842.1 hypothetical protein AC519_4597 [Pseudomonas savastanoi]KPB57032.1 Unknown protein sequence [Pseudomonas amygdali pv. myricae]MBA4704890.1 hypothetical protein [Pseudomonas savastanoi pv. savastanoi]MBI6730278.1 hypothetical protein [Pseudomonas amygdali]MBI6809749.1 hypothetical protein [Pseudomonas amygdali]